MTQLTEHQIYEKLKAPFQVKGADGKMYPDHKWKPQTKTGICVPYITSRQVATRLNEVMGVQGWSSTLIETTGNYIICELTLVINGTPNTKTDVGTPSEYAKEKGQASDALKRSAVLFGVGAYLYEMQPVKLKTVMHGNKKVPATEDGKPLVDGDALSSYINQKHPLRAKLTEIYNSLEKGQKEQLTDNFKQIWKVLTK